MTKRFLKVFGISACMAAAFSMSAFAEEITSISFAAGCDAEASLTEGNTDPVFVVNDTNAEYELSSYSATSDSNTYKTAKTYELTFEANSGFTFPSANAVTVTGKGVTEITKKTLDSDTTLVVKVKAYPYHMWEAPTIESEDLTANKISWKKNGAPTSEYIIKWTNTAGEQKIIHSTTSNSSVSISSYHKEYTGSNEDYSDSHVDGFAVRVKGTAGSNPNTAPSEWVIIGDDPTGDVDDIESYDNWGDLYDGVSSIGGGSSSKKNSGSSNGPGTALNGWIESNGSWYYYNNGTKATGWVQDGGLWYYLQPQTGVMSTGWAIVDSKRYYLNPNAGGPKGSMVTGTGVSIDGKTYTFASSGEVVSES